MREKFFHEEFSLSSFGLLAAKRTHFFTKNLKPQSKKELWKTFFDVKMRSIIHKKMEIQLHKQKVEYTLKKSKRARRMRLAIYCDGSFVVTAPRYASENIIEQFIIQKSQWIIDKLEYFKSFSGQAFIKGTAKDYAEYKDKALALAQSRILYFNKTYGFRLNKINIKNQKTRWGSCSKKGNLNFNYKIALLSERLADYIIVHELCHLKEFNHSQKFWNLVSLATPDYLEIRRELRKNRISFI